MKCAEANTTTHQISLVYHLWFNPQTDIITNFFFHLNKLKVSGSIDNNLGDRTNNLNGNE